MEKVKRLEIVKGFFWGGHQGRSTKLSGPQYLCFNQPKFSPKSKKFHNTQPKSTGDTFFRRKTWLSTKKRPKTWIYHQISNGWCIVFPPNGTLAPSIWQLLEGPGIWRLSLYSLWLMKTQKKVSWSKLRRKNTPTFGGLKKKSWNHHLWRRANQNKKIREFPEISHQKPRDGLPLSKKRLPQQNLLKVSCLCSLTFP